ncbi:MAG: ornithine cyclodeaminase family protein [Hyphomicrobiales bacterium]|nr:ornithine cyclodeaminase family protein [Hyphomicrobiales bacterium]
MHGQNYDVLMLRPQDIKDVIDMRQAIDLVEQGYREAQAFPIINAPRRRVHSRNNVRISSFPGGVDGLGVIGSLTRGEQVAHDPTSQDYPYREHPVYLLWSSTTAQLQCIMIGEITEKRIGFSSLMALRTAATSGVGFRHLARKDAKVAGVFGTGGQALHKVLALQNERAITTYKVFSRSADNRRKFCDRMATLVDAEFAPVDNPREVVVGSDVVICATSSNVPVFEGAWLEPGQHVVTIVGSNSALVDGGWLKEGRRESDDETARRADFIVTNWRESIERERQAGVFDPIQKGIIGWDKVHDLGEIVAGIFPGRTSDEQITFHANNNGTAAADLAIAQWVYEQCRQMGRGNPIELPRPGEQ